ncbi:MAG: class I SAM-dependent methyltransferase [Dehalococcoidia bacterium]
MPLTPFGRIRRALQRVRPLPFPLPEYPRSAPRVGGEAGALLLPTPRTIEAAALSPEAHAAVLDVLSKLTQNPELEAEQARYRAAEAQFGPYWRHADLLKVLWAVTTLVRPMSYLEIGVRRGKSCAVIGSVAPECSIFGFDMWMEDYFGQPNPGPEFVEGELKAAGHRGNVTFVTGKSQEAVPEFLRQHPDLYFDLITIDGDKSLQGCGSDFANALPRLKVGGVVVCDDLPLNPDLRLVWQRMIQQDGRYVGWMFAGAGGVVVAVRIADSPGWR